MSARVVEGGGFQLLTDDPIMVAVLRRLAELARPAHDDDAEYRSWLGLLEYQSWQRSTAPADPPAAAEGSRV